MPCYYFIDFWHHIPVEPLKYSLFFFQRFECPKLIDWSVSQKNLTRDVHCAVIKMWTMESFGSIIFLSRTFWNNHILWIGVWASETNIKLQGCSIVAHANSKCFCNVIAQIWSSICIFVSNSFCNSSHSDWVWTWEINEFCFVMCLCLCSYSYRG